MTKREACPGSAAHGVVWSVVLMGVLAGCADPGPRLQLQVPRPPRTQSGLGAGTAPSVPATATFDAPLVDPQAWSGSPIGTGSFSVALTPTASGGPTSIAFTDPQGGDRYVLVGDFSAASGHGLALLSDTAWVVGGNPLNGTTRAALVFDIASGDVVGVARTGTITLTAAGSALGQRVTGTLSASFVPYSPTQPACVIDADCASGEVCQGGQCVRSPPSGCTSSAQCPAGQQCQSGACVQPPAQDAGPAPGCATDRDCSSNERCVSGQCVATTPACTSSAQCGAG
ncbi:MAG: hypothetical protein IAE78_14820, partial [Myxococcus sp.]|nr:hypothetical protein [Myxococcus sp.]